MTNELYLVCLEHDPRQYSGVVNSDAGFLDELRNKVKNRDKYVKLINEVGLAEALWDQRSEYRKNLITFFSEHPECELVMQDGDGYRYNVHTREHQATPLSEARANQADMERYVSDKSVAQGMRDRVAMSMAARNQGRLAMNSAYGRPTRTQYSRVLKSTRYNRVQSLPPNRIGSVFHVRAVALSDINLDAVVRGIDGVTLRSRDVVLLTSQFDSAENGLYIVTHNGGLTRMFTNRDRGTYAVSRGSRWGGTYWIREDVESVRDLPPYVSGFERVEQHVPRYLYVPNHMRKGSELAVRALSTKDIVLDVSVFSVDGLIVEHGDLVLLTRQKDPRENGPHIVNSNNRLIPLVTRLDRGTYRVMEGERWAGTYWAREDVAPEPYRRPQYRETKEEVFKLYRKYGPMADPREVFAHWNTGDDVSNKTMDFLLDSVELSDFSTSDLRDAMAEVGLSNSRQRDVLQRLWLEQEKDNRYAMTVEELMNVPGLRGRKAEFNGIVRVLSDYAYSNEGGWTLILDGLIVTCGGTDQIVIYPEGA